MSVPSEMPQTTYPLHCEPKPGKPVRELSSDDEAGRPLSIYRLANLFLRERRIMIIVPLVTMVTAVAITLHKKPTWESTSKIIAEGVQGSSPVSSIAAQFGVNVTSAGGMASPDFYADLIKSPEVLTPVASRSYQTLRDGKPVSELIWELYETKPPSAADAVQVSRDVLANNIKTISDPITGVVTVMLTAPSRALSIELNRAVLASASDFLQMRRQTRAAAETKFVESRMVDVRSELSAAEASLRDFVAQNRSYETAPQLRLEAAQLERSVGIKQQVFLSLSQAFEQARIEAMRNSNLISVLQRPDYAISRKVPSLFRNLLLAIVLGGLVAMGIVIARTKLAREPLENPDDVEEFRALIKATIPKLRRTKSRKLRGRAPS